MSWQEDAKIGQSQVTHAMHGQVFGADGQSRRFMQDFHVTTYGGLKGEQYAMIHFIQGMLASEREIEQTPEELVSRAKSIVEQLIKSG